MSTVPDLFDTNPEEVLRTAGTVESIADTRPPANVPWAKVGTKLPPNASVAEVLELANLDWEVIKAPSQLVVEEFVNGEERTSILDNKGCYGLVRDSDHSILSPAVGRNYKPVQNRDALRVFRDFVETGNMNLETAGSLCGGRHIWGLASFGEDFQLEGGETISGNMLLLQSHRYGVALRVLFTPVRYPGGVTFVRPINVRHKMRSTYRMQHSREFSERRVKEIHELMGVAREAFQEFCERATYMSNQKLSEEASVRYLLRVLSPKTLGTLEMNGKDVPKTFAEMLETKGVNRVAKKVAENINQYPGSDGPACRGTAWGLYNAVASYIDHDSGRNVDTRLESAWMGPKASLKQDAYDGAYLTATNEGVPRK